MIVFGIFSGKKLRCKETENTLMFGCKEKREHFNICIHHGPV